MTTTDYYALETAWRFKLWARTTSLMWWALGLGFAAFGALLLVGLLVPGLDGALMLPPQHYGLSQAADALGTYPVDHVVRICTVIGMQMALLVQGIVFLGLDFILAFMRRPGWAAALLIFALLLLGVVSALFPAIGGGGFIAVMVLVSTLAGALSVVLRTREAANAHQ